MAVNKVVLKDETIMDITDTTAEAGDVREGKAFYGMDGVKTLGTLIERSGLTYEEGTLNLEADNEKPTIYFNDTHEKAPFFIAMFDTTGTDMAPTYSSIYFVYYDYYQLYGNNYYSSTGTRVYAMMVEGTRSSYSSLSNSTRHFGYNSDYMDDRYTNAPRYYVKETYFMPERSEAYPWRAGRTYKWIAIWK